MNSEREPEAPRIIGRAGRTRTSALVIAAIGFGGWLANAVIAPVRQEIDARGSGLSPGAAGAIVESGLGGAILGGFSAVAGDLAWLRASLAWEERDMPGTLAWLRVATDADPRPLFPWINGARMIGYDMTAWRGGGRWVEREQAMLALAWLDEALRFHPRESSLHIERAFLSLTRLRDPEQAAEDFRRAAGCPGAPLYAARLRADLLGRLGRKADALSWLKSVHLGLSADAAPAESELLLDRIRELEDELEVPAENRYRAAGP